MMINHNINKIRFKDKVRLDKHLFFPSQKERELILCSEKCLSFRKENYKSQYKFNYA